MLDTNTIVSDLFWNNAPKRLIDAALAGRVEPFTSPVLLLELEEFCRGRSSPSRSPLRASPWRN